MGISVLQPSFSAGELSPTLFGRVDIARYQTGLATCKNFTVMAHGGVRNRPGTRFVDTTISNQQARLIRFKFSIDDACVLVFTNLQMRVVRNGAYVLNTAGPDVGLPFTLATPYTLADLAQLNYTQSADVMTFAHTLYRPRELKRFANDNWTLTEITYVPGIAAPASATATATAGTGTTQVWQYQVTAVSDDGITIEESLPVTSNAITVFATTLTGTVVWPAVPGATYYNIYKDNTGSGIYGFTGRAVALTFTDVNIIPTKTDTPPTGVDPFVGAGNYPGAVGYYQQRLVFGGTLNKPQTSYFSRTGVFHNFGYSTPSKDDDAIYWTMASTEVNRILNYLPLRQLLTLTSGAEWTIQGTTSGFTAKTINGVPQSYNGSGFVPPLTLNNSALYLQDNGQNVSALNYSLEADGLASDDLTIWSTHLFENYGVVDWCFQKRQDSIVWCAREDGTLLGMTYIRDQQVIAWHRHETDGFVESLACVPEGTEDVVYMVVRRTIQGLTKRYIERLHSRLIPLLPGTNELDIAQAYFVDCGLSYQGWNTTAEAMNLVGGVTWEYPEVMTVIRFTGMGFSPTDIGKQIHMRDPITLSVVRLDVVGYIDPSQVSVIPTSVVPVGLRAVPTTRWSIALKTFGNLGHLEGKAVAILADGNVVGTNTIGDENLIVTGGAVTLPDHAAVVHIGLPYSADVQTLRMNIQGQETLFDKYKTVVSVSLVVHQTRGLFAGKDFTEANLYEYKPRSYEDYNSPNNLLTDVLRIDITNSWDGQGQVCIRQEDPLPVTILGIIPNLTVAGQK